MKLASFTAGNVDRFGAVTGSGGLVDLTEAFRAMDGIAAGAADTFPRNMVEFIEAGPALLQKTQAALAFAAKNPAAVPVYAAGDVTWHAPVRRPSKILCVANNNTAFQDTIMKGPETPAFFVKSAAALTGHNQPIELRPSYGVTYPEPEVGVIIGKKVKDISPSEVLDAVFGYTVHNDITSASMREMDTFHYREAMMRDGKKQIVESHASYAGRYKGSDTFAPQGPWIVTKDELTDPHGLKVECWIAGELWYTDNTRNLKHLMPAVISFMSHYQTLLPGDIISLGTAADPGGETGDKPQVVTDLNRLGGPVVISIEGIGTLTNEVQKIAG
jgi:2-keto-4-pentenoate hydratase/2-oxohepta-3-ene-1,7-dioic acid hydratase in catechol pathway